jgi:hypothetical protein
VLGGVAAGGGVEPEVESEAALGAALVLLELLELLLFDPSLRESVR